MNDSCRLLDIETSRYDCNSRALYLNACGAQKVGEIFIMRLNNISSLKRRRFEIVVTVENCCRSNYPVNTGRKLNVHKTFRKRPGRLMNVLCTLNLRPASTG